MLALLLEGLSLAPATELKTINSERMDVCTYVRVHGEDPCNVPLGGSIHAEIHGTRALASTRSAFSPPCPGSWNLRCRLRHCATDGSQQLPSTLSSDPGQLHQTHNLMYPTLQRPISTDEGHPLQGPSSPPVPRLRLRPRAPSRDRSATTSLAHITRSTRLFGSHPHAPFTFHAALPGIRPKCTFSYRKPHFDSTCPHPESEIP